MNGNNSQTRNQGKKTGPIGRPEADLPDNPDDWDDHHGADDPNGDISEPFRTAMEAVTEIVGKINHTIKHDIANYPTVKGDYLPKIDAILLNYKRDAGKEMERPTLLW